ncbi:MAG: hypothetical protein PHS07_01105 [Patescibacteria group bacterium]|jgi:hypothetical protein|nr:hypothetical protein [Patescibacteria group bacterium]
MGESSINEIINLIQPQDKLIVLKDDRPACVILGMEVYKKMLSPNNSGLDLTRQQLLDKINREIALLKTLEEEEALDGLDLELNNKNNKSQSFKEKYFSEITSQEIYYPEPLE